MPIIPLNAKPRTSGLFDTRRVKLNRREWRRYATGARRTSRFVCSWAAIMLGLGFSYIAMHYVPAAFGGSKAIISASSHNSSAHVLDTRRFGPLSPLVDLFALRRGYFAAGQDLGVQYALPANTPATLTVTQCASQVFVEVFHCTPVGEQTFSVTGKGARSLTLGQNGFYYVRAAIETDAAYRIVWTRE